MTIILPLLFLMNVTTGFQATSSATLGEQLRYLPDHTEFLLIGAKERFNRPLYGGNTAFRIDGGDLPEFVLYLPGRGGNIRFAIQLGNKIKWLHEADSIECRYRAGSLLYHIRDSWLGAGEIELQAISSYEQEGFIIQCISRNCPEGLTFFSVYGGLNAQRGKRDGDIGTEAVPISEWFQLKPEFCAGNQFSINTPQHRFHLIHPKATLTGTVSAPCSFIIRDASCWEFPDELLAPAALSETATDTPVLVTSLQPMNGTPVYFAWQKSIHSTTDTSELADYLEVRESLESPSKTMAPVNSENWPAEQLATQFLKEEETRRQRAEKLTVHTPDPFLDAAVSALCIGADATWDEPQQVVMHGAIAWRSKLLGWRGPYAMDALGWHDRARTHLSYWAGQQDISPIPDAFPGADEKSNLSRSEAALHSNGALSHSHYDMNLVYIDALLRHLRWTGDLEFARSIWPMIQRHLAWERRLFRRDYGKNGQNLPLYEAYAAIWASDELSYNGGGVAYTSAYNLFHHREAARIAALLGEDPTPYASEADAIEQAMWKLLWLEDEQQGHFAEYRDWLGLQRLHASAGLWSIYHPIDCEFIPAHEAYQMTRYVDQSVPSHVMQYPQLSENETLRVYATSHWFPYHWSVNNVVMGENLHTALAYWQAGRSEAAYAITKGAVIASMFAGICPGNVGSMNFLDAYRGESQRDFADGAGVMARTLVEGLFGIHPDLLQQELTIRPGFPQDWEFAEMQHDSIVLHYTKTSGNHCKIEIHPRFSKEVSLCLKLPLKVDSSSLTINGQKPRSIRSVGAEPWGYLECRAEPSSTFSVHYEIVAKETTESLFEAFSTDDSTPTVSPIDWTRPVDPDICVPITLEPYFNAKVSDIFHQTYRSPRSPFPSLSIPLQGIGGWAGAYNTQYEVQDSGLCAEAKRNKGSLKLPNGVSILTPADKESDNVIFVSRWDNYPDEVTVPLPSHIGAARRAYLLLAGSTHWMQSHMDNGEITFYYQDGSSDALPLHNPTTWWPIDQDYYVDDFQFQHPGPFPLRLDLKTGVFREISPVASIQKAKSIDGGAATVLTFPLDPQKKLQSIRLTALSNEVVIGLMSVTLEKEP